ncbi:hypothetical protein [Bradyrhizobium sp. USDA 4486]
MKNPEAVAGVIDHGPIRLLLFDIVRDDVWAATRHEQQPFTYGSPPGREDYYLVARK